MLYGDRIGCGPACAGLGALRFGHAEIPRSIRRKKLLSGFLVRMCGVRAMETVCATCLHGDPSTSTCSRYEPLMHCRSAISPPPLRLLKGGVFKFHLSGKVWSRFRLSRVACDPNSASLAGRAENEAVRSASPWAPVGRGREKMDVAEFRDRHSGQCENTFRMSLVRQRYEIIF